MNEDKDRVTQIDGDWFAIYRGYTSDEWYTNDELTAKINRLRRLQAKLRKAVAEEKRTKAKESASTTKIWTFAWPFSKPVSE